MSHLVFNNLWSEAQKEFRIMIKEEKKGGTITGERDKVLDGLTELYFKYASIYEKIDKVYDQMVHPQKLPLVRRVLDLVIARMLEIRNVMVKAELSEYFYQDEYMHWLHWIPDQLDIKIPKYYEHNRGPEWMEHQVWLEGESVRKEAEDREAALQAEIEADEAAAAAALKLDLEEDLDMEMDEAIITIQTAERARQGRAKYQMAKYFLDEEEAQRLKKKLLKLSLEGRMDPDKAATIIQRMIRRFLARHKVMKLRDEELEFLGLSWGPHRVNSPLKKALEATKKHERVIELAAERRRKMQRLHVQNYIEAEITIEARLRSLEAPEMAERMKWQIRTWALDVKEKTGKVPDIPKAEHGGSKFIFCPETLPEEVLEKAMAALDGKKKKKGKKGKDKKKKDKKKKKGKKDKKKKKSGDTLELLPPKNFDDMVKDNIEYNQNWRRRDETHNPEQRHEDQLIIHDKRQIVGAEVRAQVDSIMRSELKVLKQDLEKKKGKKGKGKKGKGKGKKGKGKGKGKGKKGKGKKGKKGKKKKGKDFTKDRTLQSIFEELVKNGIIKKYPKVKFSDLQGEPSIINGSIRKFHEAGSAPPMPGEDLNLRFPGDPNPAPTFGDIKRAVKDICVLPVGSPTVHAIAPFTKSVLLAGPEGSGKHSLLYAVCTAMGATFMDLTAKNIAGKYPGKGKTGLKMLIHLVGKVGRMCPPTVVLVDDCEKMFQKKIPKEEKKTEPKRLKKALKKFLKTVDEEDPIILVGITKQPWKSSQKPLKKLYERMIYIPKPEYGSRLNWWRKLLEDNAESLGPDINFSLLAKLSESWTLGAIKKAVEKVTSKIKAKQKKDEESQTKPEDVAPAGATTTPAATPTIAGKAPAAGTAGAVVPAVPAQAGANSANDATSTEKKPERKLILMNDLLKELSLQDPVFQEMDKTWTKWFNKTPLQKARMKSQINLTGKKKGKGKGGKDKGKGKGKGKGKKR